MYKETHTWNNNNTLNYVQLYFYAIIKILIETDQVIDKNEKKKE